MHLVVLVLAAITSVQFGSALAATLFDEVGPGGAVLYRLLFSAVLLWAIWRPSLRGRSRRQLALAAAFGLNLAAMNSCFYLAIDRIPLGIAITLEFVGPLGVAIATSRRRLDLLWIALAGGGIAILSAGDVGELDPVGIALALIAGALWAGYILISARVGREFGGSSGLALALPIGALAAIPYGLLSGGHSLISGTTIGLGIAVAVLSAAIPYSLELEALRRMTPGVFGVLMSLEPAVGVLAGFAILDQELTALEGTAIALVVAASAGAARSARTALRD